MRSVAYLPNQIGGPPSTPNYFFNSSANIAPSFHVGPRMYGENGYVPQPLTYTGQPGPADFHNTTPPAGELSTAPGGLAAMLSFPHPISIGGRNLG